MPPDPQRGAAPFHAGDDFSIKLPLTYSLLAGLATAIGGAVVFFLRAPPLDGARTASSYSPLPPTTLSYTLGLAAGVMFCVAGWGMVLPVLPEIGHSAAALTVGSGAATFAALERLLRPQCETGGPRDAIREVESAANDSAEAKTIALRDKEWRLGLIMMITLMMHKYINVPASRRRRSLAASPERGGNKARSYRIGSALPSLTSAHNLSPVVPAAFPKDWQWLRRRCSTKGSGWTSRWPWQSITYRRESRLPSLYTLQQAHAGR